MYQFFVEPDQISGKTITILGGDVHHIKNVLRMKAGDEISVSNGIDGKEYRCGITALADEAITCELWFIKEDGVELPSWVYLFQGLPKGDKMEMIIQKAVELGVYRIIPVASRRCVVKLDSKRAKVKTERWQGICEAAAKQSRRVVIPKVQEPMTFSQAITWTSDMDVKIIPYELAEDMEKTRTIINNVKAGQKIAIFIGPEGGFEESEIVEAIENGVQAVTLGRRILRTETAGLAVLAWIMLQLESN